MPRIKTRVRRQENAKRVHGNKGKKREKLTREERLYRTYQNNQLWEGADFLDAMVFQALNTIDMACRRGNLATEVGIGAIPSDRVRGNLCRVYLVAEYLREIVTGVGAEYEDASETCWSGFDTQVHYNSVKATISFLTVDRGRELKTLQREISERLGLKL